MIIDCEDQYQKALTRLSELYNAEEGTKAYEEQQDLVAEIQIYEHKYHPKDEPEEQTYEFWTARKGVTNPDHSSSEDFNVEKIKESDLTKQHIDLLAGEFLNAFDKLPAAAKRIVRKKLQY